MFEYYMVQIPPNIGVRMGRTQDAAASYLEDVVGQYVVEGWEFYSIETIGIIEHPGCGCLAALVGIKTTVTPVYVIVLRRIRANNETSTASPPQVST